MTVLSDGEIRKLIQNGVIKDFGDLEEQLQPASFDVRLASKMLIPVPSSSPVRVGEVEKIDYFDGFGPIIIQPGGFILASTIERVEIPDDLVAIVNGRSTFGRLGLTVHITAGYIDPGFRGNITLEIFNAGPHAIVLEPGERIAQLVFESLSSPAQRPYGCSEGNNKYQFQSGVSAPRDPVKV